jgi:inhibitor of cysteine peptidase
MKKRTHFYLSLAFVAAAAFSMNAQNFISVDKSKAGQQITIAPDQVLEVRLPMAPSNGYAWYLKNSNNENIQGLGALQQVGDWTFVSDHPEQPIGASGYQIIRYIAKASGSANLHFELIRPWTQEKALDAYDIEAVSAGAYTGDYKAPEQTKVEDKVEVNISANKSAALPASFSWLDKKMMTPVKNQGSCGSCWAFASCGVFESMIKAHDNVTRDLSEQWLINCTSGSNCSDGWFPVNMFEQGAVYEADVPYKGKDGTCASSYTRHEKSTSSKEIAEIPTTEQIKTAIYTYGPVWVGVNAGSNFSSYSSGIFSKTDAGECNHAVVLCGWDDANGYWILRNSWGTSWGENQGYMRIKYGTSKIGTKATYIVYGTTTSIDGDQIAAQQTAVYPNPIVDGKLTVNLNQFENNQPITITIHDIQGKVVYKQEEKQNFKIEIDAETFSKGMYFVNVSSQSKTANYKVVKE